MNDDDGISVFDFSGFSDNFGVGVIYPTALSARTFDDVEADNVQLEVAVDAIFRGARPIHRTKFQRLELASTDMGLQVLLLEWTPAAEPERFEF